MASTGMCRWIGYGFRPLCPKQGIQLRASLSVLNSVNDSCESIVLIINKAVVLNRVLKLRVLS